MHDITVERTRGKVRSLSAPEANENKISHIAQAGGVRLAEHPLSSDPREP